MMLLGILVAAMAVVLLIFGFRGKTVDQHPVCRGCRFDLEGLYPKITTCPECGAKLGGMDEDHGTARENGVRIGNRERRRGVIALGAVLLVLAVGVSVVATSAANWDRHKPLAVLSAELRYMVGRDDPVRAEAIITEILGRLTADKLDAARLDTLVDHALKVQADDDAIWLDAWAQLIESYDEAVGLSNDQLFAYLKAGSKITITVRDAVRIGDEILVGLDFAPARIGVGRRLLVRARVEGGLLGVGKGAVAIIAPPDSSGPRRSPMTMMATKTSDGETRMGAGFLLGLDGRAFSAGVHLLSIDLRFEPVDADQRDTDIGHWTQTYETTINVLPRDDTDIALFDPDRFSLLAEDVTVDSLVVRTGVNGGRYLIGKVTINESVPLAFRATAIVGDARYDMGTMTRDWLGRGGSRQFQLYAKNLPPDFDARSIDIELKYDRAPARHRMDMPTIYPLNVLLKDVPIEQPESGG
jgi:hypothetical protein